jgi:hypothetical protein
MFERAQATPFFYNWSPKNAGIILFMFAGRFGIPILFGRRLVHNFGEFFHQLKGRQQIGRKIPIQSVLRRMRGLDGLLSYAVKNYDLLRKIQDKKNYF